MIGVDGAIALLRDLRDERLAITALVALTAGDSLDAAIARLENVEASLPDAKEFKGNKQRLTRRVAKLTIGHVKRSLSDLRQLRDMEA